MFSFLKFYFHYVIHIPVNFFTGNNNDINNNNNQQKRESTE